MNQPNADQPAPDSSSQPKSSGLLSKLGGMFASRSAESTESATSSMSPPACSDFEQWMRRTYIVCEPHKIIYCPIEKNACTYFKTLMLTHSDVAGEYGASGLKSHTFINQRRKPLLDDPQRMNDPEYLKFVVVREPVGRVVSAYLNKFVLNRNFRWAIDTAEKFARLDSSFKGGADDLTFRQFVRVLVECDDDQLDLHWRPQAAFCEPAIDQFDWVVPLEGLTEFLPVLESRMQTTISPEKTRNQNHYRGYTTGELGAAACDVAASDLRKLDQYPDTPSLVADDLAEQLALRYQRDLRLYELAVDRWKTKGL